MKYLLLEGNSAEHISRLVTEHLKKGWRLHGPALIVAGQDMAGDSVYAQAMTYEVHDAMDARTRA